MIENDVFTTKSIDLAAYLMCCDIQLTEEKIEENKCVFVFPKDENTMEVFRNFKNDVWLKGYNNNKRTCLNIMHNVRNQANK